MKYLIFGGAFDPIHKSHLEKAAQALDMIEYDTALLMPAYGHVFGKQMALSSHRCNMVDKAIKDFGDDRLKPSIFEIVHNLSGATIDTITLLFHTVGEVFNPTTTAYLIGMDHANEIDKWERWEELIKLIPFVVINRGGVVPTRQWYIHPPHQMIYTNGTPLSSTQIRKDLKAGVSVVDKLMPSTIKYIEEHELYV